MEDLNAPVFAQAKLEYTKQLKDILIQRMYDGMYEIYQKSKIFANLGVSMSKNNDKTIH